MIAEALLTPVAKRLVDVIVGITLVAVLVPVFLVIAILVRIDSEGPILYRCARVGRQGREFQLLKFRKMHNTVTGGLPLTLEHDERFTRIGRLLARTKLDELPQLWNVIRGEMSLVGPRPEAPEFVERVPAVHTVLVARPGITGLAQLAFAREGAVLDRSRPEEDYVVRILPAKLQLDLLYIARTSVLLDAKIVFWTVLMLATRREVAVHRADGSLGFRQRVKVAEPTSDQSSELPPMTALGGS